MVIIPAIDIINSKCVRLMKGDYKRKKIYHEDPIVVAKSFEEAGIKRLHLVDLDGARAKNVANLSILKEIASQTSLRVDFGGGVKTRTDLVKVFNHGASQVTGGSIAATDQSQFISWLSEFGSDRIILGADTLNGQIMVSGWQKATMLGVEEFLDFYVEKGIKYVICTDISKDGMMLGPSFALYEKILKRHSGIHLIASGGVSKISDLEKLRDMGIHGAITGKAIYEGMITLDQLALFSC